MLVDDSGGMPLLHPLVNDRSCPVVQYADETLVLVQAKEGQVRRLKQLLDVFTAATGLVINYHKCKFVLIHVVTVRINKLAAILGYPFATYPQSYLDLPLSKKKLPDAVLDSHAIKVEHCIPSWWVHLLNRSGRLTLINFVLSAQLTYTALAVMFHKSTIRRLKSRDAGTASCSSEDCQVAWPVVRRLKEEGGLEVVDVVAQNT
ncbi:unnamed protein product [Urochloa humidicola]